MTTNIRNVLGYAVRDPQVCTRLVWTTETALNDLRTARPQVFPSAFTDPEKAELLDFLHGRAQTWGSLSPAPLVLDLDGKTYTGAEVLYIISHTVGVHLIAPGGNVPPAPPPPF